MSGTLPPIMAAPSKTPTSVGLLAEYGRRLRLVRIAIKQLHGHTQGRICREIGVAQSRWSNWEAGLHPMDTLSLMVFTRRYTVSSSYLTDNVKTGLRHDLAEKIQELEGQRIARGRVAKSPPAELPPPPPSKT